MATLAASAIVLAATTSANAQETKDTKETKGKAKAEAAQAKTQTQGQTQIIFVPRNMLETDKDSGKLKENTFYWANETDDATQGPKVADDGGTPYLLIKGSGDAKTPKAKTRVTMVRAFNVPAGAQSVVLAANLKATYDEWSDNAFAPSGSPYILYGFVKDGKQARSGSLLERRGDKTLTLSSPVKDALKFGDKNWQVLQTKLGVPAGAQQLVITAGADFPSSLSISSLETNFSNEPFTP